MPVIEVKSTVTGTATAVAPAAATVTTAEPFLPGTTRPLPVGLAMVGADDV